MSSIGIATDSHSSISQQEAARLGVRVLGVPCVVDGQDYLDGVTISSEEFFAKLRANAEVSTSQPSPEQLTRLWDEMLAVYDEILYIPISSGLSGSCATAKALAEDAPYAGRVYVVDNGRVASPLHRSILDALEMVQEGYSAAEICRTLEQYKEDMTIYLGVETLTYLKRGGRITPAVAALGMVLNIKPVIHFSTGQLDVFAKSRGTQRSHQVMLDALREEMNTRFASQLAKGEVYLLAATSASEQETEAWLAEIRAAFPGMDILCDPLSLGVACHTGPGALGVGCACRPPRPPRS